MERDYVNWSLPQLECEFTRLQQHEAEPFLTEDRRTQVQAVMSYIAFEGLMRQREMNEQEVITGQLELNYKGM